MISLKCPFCQIGLKVDEKKLPQGISTFKCPKCNKQIPVSLLNANSGLPDSSDTILFTPAKTGAGRLTVQAGSDTPEQIFPLHEGLISVGRRSSGTDVSLPIETKDKLMSRNHLNIEVKKDSKGRYKHYLSDNNSKNRTLYNNKYLSDKEVVVLNDNDEIVIGRTSLRFNI